MIEPRKFVRGGPEWQAQTSRGPRRASAERGPVRGQRNFWDVADDKSETETLGLRAPTPQMFVSDVWNALPLWHMGRRWTFDPFSFRVPILGPAESWLPRLSAAPRGWSGGCVVLKIACS